MVLDLIDVDYFSVANGFGKNNNNFWSRYELFCAC